MRYSGRRQGMPTNKGELEECDICGWAFLKRDLIPQRGMLVCEADLDEPNPLDRRDDESWQ